MIGIGTAEFDFSLLLEVNIYDHRQKTLKHTCEHTVGHIHFKIACASIPLITGAMTAASIWTRCCRETDQG